MSLADIQVDPVTNLVQQPLSRLEDIIIYGQRADEVGLDIFAIGEHHTDDFAISSPAVVLGALARETTNIRLASAVTIISVHDPVRVFQDFATVDQLSGGRAEIFAGRSAFAEPFSLFGLSMGEYDALYEEKLALLVELCRNERVTWSGKYRTPLRDHKIVPRPVQEPLPVSVAVGGTPGSVERAGRLGLPLVLAYVGGPYDRAAEIIEQYRAAGKRAKQTDRLQVTLATHMYVASDANDVETVFPYYQEYQRPKTPGGGGWSMTPEQFVTNIQPGQAIMIGTSDQLVEKILKMHESLNCDRILGQVDWGGLPRDRVIACIDRFGTEVAPQVRVALS